MQCVCGFQAPFGKLNSKGTLSSTPNVKALNRHRRNCDAFWQAVKAEIERIAIMLYGEIAPVTSGEWNRHKSDGMPAHGVFADWGYPWSRVQQKVGQPQSVRGNGAVSWARRPRTEFEQNLALDCIALTIQPMTTTVENYLAQTYREGLTICEQSFVKTGRMWVR
jgi:hypothetical protein